MGAPCDLVTFSVFVIEAKYYGLLENKLFLCNTYVLPLTTCMCLSKLFIS